MSLPYAGVLVPDSVLSELSERGQAIYVGKLQKTLEADALNQFVAIHVDTEEYAVARTSAAAMRAMRQRFASDGRLFIRRIGSEPQYGLASRIIQSDMIEGKQK